MDTRVESNGPQLRRFEDARLEIQHADPFEEPSGSRDVHNLFSEDLDDKGNAMLPGGSLEFPELAHINVPLQHPHKIDEAPLCFDPGTEHIRSPGGNSLPPPISGFSETVDIQSFEEAIAKSGIQEFFIYAIGIKTQ